MTATRLPDKQTSPRGVTGGQRAAVLPTFLIGGAPKAGTTALWALLEAHPQVFMSRVKEPRFLTRRLNEPAPGVRMIGPDRSVNFHRGLAWYESLFSGSDGALARGEASPQYLGAQDGPELMERFLPGVKIVFALRQPVDRAYSHYWQHWKKGWRMPRFGHLLDDHPELRYLDYMSRYAQHVERYRQTFGPDRVHLVLFDDLRAEPERVYRQLCRFIGVDDRFSPPSFGESYNQFASPRLRILHRALMFTHFRRFGRVVPAPLRPPLRRLRSWAERMNRGSSSYIPLDRALRARLTHAFEEDIAYVERLTRPLPEWRES
jgi:Sulfotransferase family